MEKMDENKNEAPNSQDSDISIATLVLNKETGANDAATSAHMGSRAEATSSSSWDAADTSSSDESLNDWTIVPHPFEEQHSSSHIDPLIEGYVCIGENLPSNSSLSDGQEMIDVSAGCSSYNRLHEGPNSQMQNPAPQSNSVLIGTTSRTLPTCPQSHLLPSHQVESSASLSPVSEPEVETVVDNTSIPEQAIECNGPPTNCATSSTSQSTDAAPNSRMQNPAPVPNSVVSTALQSNTSIDYLGYGRHVQPLHEGNNSSAWAHGACSRTPPTHHHGHLLHTHQGDYSSMWAHGASSQTVPTYTLIPQLPPGFRPQLIYRQPFPQGNNYYIGPHGASSGPSGAVPIYPSPPHRPPGFRNQQRNPLVRPHFRRSCYQVPPRFRPSNTKDEH